MVLLQHEHDKLHLSSLQNDTGMVASEDVAWNNSRWIGRCFHHTGHTPYSRARLFIPCFCYPYDFALNRDDTLYLLPGAGPDSEKKAITSQTRMPVVPNK